MSRLIAAPRLKKASSFLCASLALGLMVSVAWPQSVSAQAQDDESISFTLPGAGQAAGSTNVNTRRGPANQVNPWDADATNAAAPSAAPATAAPAAEGAEKTAEEAAKPKHWTEMNHAELTAELERPGTSYSPQTKKEMRNRLKVLDPNAVAAPAESATGAAPVAAQTGATVPVVGAEGGANAAVPVRMVPAVTPWWKLPKSQQAAAKEAQRSQQGQATSDEDLSPRDRIYKNIEQNRGR